MVTKRKMLAKTAFVRRVKMKKVSSANPQTSRYSAMTALYAGDAMPSAILSPVVEYAAARPKVGSCSMPNESQNTAKRPMTIIGKKLPMIHSKISARMSKTGPVKKKIPLLGCQTVSILPQRHLHLRDAI